MAVQATYQSMGLRSEKAVSAHLLLENAHESNLVSDISKVDYLAGNLGARTCAPLPGLPTFVDDVYVFGYLRREDYVVHGGRLSCTTEEDSSAKNTVARISIAVRESMGMAPDGTTRGHIQTNIVHTLATRDNAEGGAIRATVSRIEFDTDKKAQAKWRELLPVTEPVGLFVAKVDVSEIPMDDVGHGQIRENNLLASSRWRLQALGAGDRDKPGQGIPVEGRPQGLLEPDPGRCRPRPPAPGHPPGSGRKRAGAPGAAGGRATRTRAISSPGGPSPKSQGHQEGVRPAIRRIPLPALRLDDLPRRAPHSSLPGFGRRGWRARDGRGNADLRALPQGGGRGDRRYRGAAKGTPPLLCYLGAERTTPQKKKDRLAALATVRKANVA